MILEVIFSLFLLCTEPRDRSDHSIEAGATFIGWESYSRWLWQIESEYIGEQGNLYLWCRGRSHVSQAVGDGSGEFIHLRWFPYEMIQEMLEREIRP